MEEEKAHKLYTSLQGFDRSARQKKGLGFGGGSGEPSFTKQSHGIVFCKEGQAPNREQAPQRTSRNAPSCSPLRDHSPHRQAFHGRDSSTSSSTHGHQGRYRKNSLGGEEKMARDASRSPPRRDRHRGEGSRRDHSHRSDKGRDRRHRKRRRSSSTSTEATQSRKRRNRSSSGARQDRCEVKYRRSRSRSPRARSRRKEHSRSYDREDNYRGHHRSRRHLDDRRDRARSSRHRSRQHDRQSNSSDSSSSESRGRKTRRHRSGDRDSRHTKSSGRQGGRDKTGQRTRSPGAKKSGPEWPENQRGNTASPDVVAEQIPGYSKMTGVEKLKAKTRLLDKKGGASTWLSEDVGDARWQDLVAQRIAALPDRMEEDLQLDNNGNPVHEEPDEKPIVLSTKEVENCVQAERLHDTAIFGAPHQMGAPNARQDDQNAENGGDSGEELIAARVILSQQTTTWRERAAWLKQRRQRAG